MDCCYVQTNEKLMNKLHLRVNTSSIKRMCNSSTSQQRNALNGSVFTPESEYYFCSLLMMILVEYVYSNKTIEPTSILTKGKGIIFNEINGFRHIVVRCVE